MNLKELIRTASLPALLGAIKDLSDLGNPYALRLDAAIVRNSQVGAPKGASHSQALFRDQEYMKALQKGNKEVKFNERGSHESASIAKPLSSCK